MRTDEHLLEHDALRGKQVQHELLHLLEVMTRIALTAEAILVADHHQPIAGAPQLAERGKYAWQQPYLVETIHLEVVRLLDQRAVAIDE
jgi:hypothetical protein